MDGGQGSMGQLAYHSFSCLLETGLLLNLAYTIFLAKLTGQ